MHTTITRFSLAVAIAVTSACSSAGTNVYQDAAVGGVAGAAVGAGTGAIIASSISNGDVGQSALLGTAIGLPVGILAGVAYTNYSQNSRISENHEAIRSNMQHLKQQERELEYLRMKAFDESNSKTVAPDPSTIEHQYKGPSLGNPFRR